ncbi:MAG: hypothetical protein U5Q03_00170 [Bacteroidota bacterium]|nr:hypothetical protein [Bacteroidota bacterium]
MKLGGSLVDKYISGEINCHTIKATSIIRDTIKVLGTKNIILASFAIFYDDQNCKIQGGTEHTMRIFMENQIPFIDQELQ